MRQSVRRLVQSLLLPAVLAVAVSACGGAASRATNTTSGTTSAGTASASSASTRILRAAIIGGYEHGGATPAQAKAVAACVLPLLAEHGITSVLKLGTSSDPSLARTATTACKKKLGIK